MKHLLLRRSELISLAVALVILLAIAIFSSADWVAYRQNRAEVLATRQVLQETIEILQEVTDAETGQRGYILTGDDQYLKPYSAAVQMIPSKLDALDRETLGDPRLHRQVEELRRHVEDKLTEMSRTIDARRRNGISAGVDAVISGAGATFMQEIRQSTAGLQSDLQQRFEQGSRSVRSSSDRSHFITLAGSVILLALVAVAAINISEAAEKREQLIASLDQERNLASGVRDLLKTTLASIGDAVLVTDRAKRITYLNPVAQGLTGWREDEASGRNAAEVFRIVNENTGQAVESPVESILREGKPAAVVNRTVLISRDGRETPIDDSGSPLVAPEGKLLGAVIVFRDVTARRATERERERLLSDAQAARQDAERQRRHLHSLFVQAPASINIYRGPEHIFELVHPLAKQYFGRDVTGLSARDVHRPQLVKIFDEVYRSGEPRNLHEFPLLEQGQEAGDRDLYVNYFIRPWLEADGSVAGVMTLGIDVTEQVAMKRAMQTTEERLRETAKLESLGVLAGGIAHDFNNLLVGIIGNASLALDLAPRDEALRDLIEGVLKAGERAAVLTHQMLAYSGKGRFIVERLDLSDLVTDVLPLLQSSVPRTVSVRTDLAEQLPAIEADTAQIQQVFMNLAINGAEACEGSGVVTIRTAIEHVSLSTAGVTFGLPAPEPGTYVLLEVADTGSGMSEETKSRIFDPFFTTKFTGRGLGLSAVLGIIRSHKGAIQVSSEPGEGSTFRVLFPAAGEHPVEPRTQAPPRSSVNGSGTVLLIDDEDLVRNLGRATLERYGYRVLEAIHGQQAVNLLGARNEDIALVILDLTMPVMSGAETLRELRKVRPRVPIILSSGFSETEAKLRFSSEELAGFLQKPYTAIQLAEAVHLAISTVQPGAVA